MNEDALIALARMRFAADGRPLTKLPCCPACDEDELWSAYAAALPMVSCYRCPFLLRLPDRRADRE